MFLQAIELQPRPIAIGWKSVFQRTAMTVAPLRLNLETGSVTFAFTPEAALDLQEAIKDLLQRLKMAAGEVGKKTPQSPMEYRHTGEVFLECFCNPNIWPSPFAAKLLLTIRDDKIRLTSEAELTRIVEDLQEYLAANG